MASFEDVRFVSAKVIAWIMLELRQLLVIGPGRTTVVAGKDHKRIVSQPRFLPAPLKPVRPSNPLAGQNRRTRWFLLFPRNSVVGRMGVCGAGRGR